MNLSRKLFAEFFGTAWLVFGGCGAAIFAAAYPGLGIGFLGVALAFGLTLLTMAFAIGHISGCHINPAVSIGLAIGRRFPMAHVLPYIAAQVSGAFVAASALYVIARGKPGFVLGSFAANGYGAHSPGGYTMQSCFVAEMILTFFFLFIIFGATDVRAPKGFGPIAIGLSLTLIHLVGIPITNTSVNPARSTSQALFVHGWALSQLWLFWLAPILGAVLAGLVYRVFFAEKPEAASRAVPARPEYEALPGTAAGD
jgi:aquaporin Z